MVMMKNETEAFIMALHVGVASNAQRVCMCKVGRCNAVLACTCCHASSLAVPEAFVQYWHMHAAHMHCKSSTVLGSVPQPGH